MKWYIVPLTFLVFGFYKIHGCVENHVQCLKSFQWKYRAYRTFHHISNAEICQGACSRYSSRLNYFTFDVSIHRCICLANCLIHRGDEAQNDVTGTVSDADPSDLCKDTKGQEVQVDRSKLLFFDYKNILTFNSKERELHSIANVKLKSISLKAVSKLRGKLFVMGVEYQSQLVEKPRDFVVTMEIEKGTLNWKEVPCPSDLKMLPLSRAIRLSDGRIWLYDYKKRHTILFDGENFLPSIEPIWVKNGYGLMGASFGVVHNDYIIAVGATRYDFETKKSIANQTLSIFMLDVNRNESKTVQVIPNKFLSGASIWSVIQDGQIKVLIGRGMKSQFELDPSLIVIDLKSGDMTILESSAHYLPTKERNVGFTAIVMLGQEPYFVQKNSSVAKITNLQDFADGKGDTNTILVPGASWFLKGLQFADVDDWLAEDTP